VIMVPSQGMQTLIVHCPQLCPAQPDVACSYEYCTGRHSHGLSLPLPICKAATQTTASATTTNRSLRQGCWRPPLPSNQLTPIPQPTATSTLTQPPPLCATCSHRWQQLQSLQSSRVLHARASRAGMVVSVVLPRNLLAQAAVMLSLVALCHALNLVASVDECQGCPDSNTRVATATPQPWRPSAKCQAAADSFCRQDCLPAIRGSGCPGPQYARDSGPGQAQWRCYDAATLAADNQTYRGGHCFCTREGPLEAVLAKCGDKPPTPAPPRPLPSMPVFAPGDANISCFRIPAVVQSAKGSLLAFAEARHGSCSDAAVHERKCTLG